MDTITSGVYTPEIVTATGVEECNFPAPVAYTRVGDIVTVSGVMLLVPASNPPTAPISVTFTVPVACADSSLDVTDASGVASNGKWSGVVRGASANANTASLFSVLSGEPWTEDFWTFTFQYRCD